MGFSRSGEVWGKGILWEGALQQLLRLLQRGLLPYPYPPRAFLWPSLYSKTLRPAFKPLLPLGLAQILRPGLGALTAAVVVQPPVVSLPPPLVKGTRETHSWRTAQFKALSAPVPCVLLFSPFSLSPFSP